MLDNIEIGKRLESRRLALGYTMEQVASKIGVTKSTIQRYEKGKIQKIKLPVIESYCSVLQINPNWVIGLSQNMERVPTAEGDGEHSNKNIIRIAGRNGLYIEKSLTDEQLSALETLIASLPDAEDL